MVFRAFAKIAINLLAAFCPNTLVNRDTFGPVIRRIVGESYVQPQLLRAVGFVRAEGIRRISVKSAHTFRLLYHSGQWNTLMSFFGGRIGAFIAFPGPNGESWNSADIVMPLREGDYRIQTSKFVEPFRVQVETGDMTKIAPSVEVINAEVTSVVRQVRT
jgi:hypothetical protein